jgi:pimeloyl-ACP methyl ester carboxylesterase
MIPTVLIPGLLCSAEVFEPQVAALWPRGPVTVASTLEGESIPRIAAATLAHAPPRFAVAGLSMGGRVALEIARQAPGRVLGLALLGASARPDTPAQVRQRRALVERARTGDFDSFVAELLGGVLHPDRRHDPALRALNVRMGRAVGPDGFARQTEALIARPDPRPDLAEIRVPTVILVGDSDPLTPRECADELAAAIPGARLVVIPRCGHGSTRERPEAVCRELLEWMA